jgi:hypothetical protein
VRRTVAGLDLDLQHGLMDDEVRLYPFRYFDAVRRRWVNARYKASIEDIRARYEKFEITGEPEIRSGPPRQFVPPGSR